MNLSMLNELFLGSCRYDVGNLSGVWLLEVFDGRLQEGNEGGEMGAGGVGRGRGRGVIWRKKLMKKM